MSIQTYYINMTETDMWKRLLLFFLRAIFAFESSLVLFELKHQIFSQDSAIFDSLLFISSTFALI